MRPSGGVRAAIFPGIFLVPAGLIVLQATWLSAAVLVGSLVSVRTQVLE